MNHKPAQVLKSGISFIEIIVVVALISLFTIPLVFNARQVGNAQALRISSQVLSNEITDVKMASRDARTQKAWGIQSVDQKHFQIISGRPQSFEVSKTLSLENGVTFENNFSIWFEIGTGQTESKTIVLLNELGKKIRIDVGVSGAISKTEL